MALVWATGTFEKKKEITGDSLKRKVIDLTLIGPEDDV